MIHWSKSLARRARGPRTNSVLPTATAAVVFLLAVVLSSCRLSETIPLVEGEGEGVNIRGRPGIGVRA